MKKTRREPIVLSQMHPFTLFLVLSGCIVVVFALIRIDSVAKFFGRMPFSACNTRKCKASDSHTRNLPG